MSTKQWFGYEYRLFYDIAKHRLDTLYFDGRYWYESEIFEFFDDLKYGDYETYERVIRRFPEYKRTDFKAILKANKDCERRYMKWKQQLYPQFVPWQE
jgi:hypothetical protein